MSTQKVHFETISSGPKVYQRLWIDSCLQLYTRDEAIYHEALVVPALSIAESRKLGPLRVLILGGGDGMCAREVLRWGKVESITIVDIDLSVVELARGDLAKFNNHSLSDPRLSVVICDAKKFISQDVNTYDLIIMDLTFPQTAEMAHFFTKSFLSQLAKRLTRNGVLAGNTLSPVKNAVGFFSIAKTMKEVGLSEIPLRVKIPSFSAEGYGDWGFLLSSWCPIDCDEWQSIVYHPDLHFLNESSAREMLRFPPDNFRFGVALSQTLELDHDLLALLSIPEIREKGGQTDLFLQGLGVNALPDARNEQSLASISFGANIMRSARALDLKSAWQEQSNISEKTLATVFLALTILNAVYPDNAYAKGYSGFSSSRYRSSSGSGGGDGEPLSFFSEGSQEILLRPDLTHPFQSPTLFGGEVIRRRVIKPDGAGQETWFALTSQLHIGDDGEFFYFPKFKGYYYKIEHKSLLLFKEDGQKPLFEFPLTQEIASSFNTNIAAQRKALEITIANHEKWLGWTAVVSPVSTELEEETKELQKLKSLSERFKTISDLVAAPDSDFSGFALAPGVRLQATGAQKIVFYKSSGRVADYPWAGFSKEASHDELTPSPEMDGFLKTLFAFHRVSNDTPAAILQLLPAEAVKAAPTSFPVGGAGGK